jgi:hypothetical protein
MKNKSFSIRGLRCISMTTLWSAIIVLFSLPAEAEIFFVSNRDGWG